MTAEGVALRPAPVPDPISSAEGRIALDIDTRIYGLASVMRAAYKFTDRSYVFVWRPDDSERVVVALTPKNTADNLAALVGEFCNELLDQQIRESLGQEFGDIRTLLVAQAFSEGNLLDPDRDDGDYQSDPRGALSRR